MFYNRSEAPAAEVDEDNDDDAAKPPGDDVVLGVDGQLVRSEMKEVIGAEEKAQLRREFEALMRERFLRAGDTDFNYKPIDNDYSLDDMRTRARDDEDDYFDGEDGYDDQREEE